MILWKRVTLSLAAALVLVGLSACFNVFDPIDNPGGDEQILSAARAAFDKGDLAEARPVPDARVGRAAGDAGLDRFGSAVEIQQPQMAEPRAKTAAGAGAAKGT